ncbi:uncharacterized protein LOC120349965 [Nilaparvata lugens]|uniref:uncharacterized protein LOC120349965 n=1 Tax=Nilaparvata lugens TaxID=108931 RepID=UPI00193DBE08|nr:uncharacterized protein LOC120349965 [Nilaparvata lugens]
MEDYYEQQYVFDGIFYKIIEKEEIHTLLAGSPDFFQSYLKKNDGHIEMAGVATEATTDSHVWTTEATKLLLEEYHTRTNKFRNSKIKNVILWREIIDVFEAHGYSGITEKILDDKFRSMKRTFNRIKKNNDTRKSTGKGSIKPWEFYDSMADILQDDSTVNLHKAFIMSSSFAPPSTSTSPAHPLPSTSFARPPPSSSPANPLPSTSLPVHPHHHLQPIHFPQLPLPVHPHHHLQPIHFPQLPLPVHPHHHLQPIHFPQLPLPVHPHHHLQPIHFPQHPPPLPHHHHLQPILFPQHPPPLNLNHHLQPILFPQQPSPLHHHQHPLPILSHQPRQLSLSQIRQPREIFQKMIHLPEKG